MSRPLLQLKGVHTHIGAYHILHGVDLLVPEGQVTLLLGRNGAGKTTTLRTLMGLWPASQGKLLFDGEDITQADTPSLAQRGIAYVPETMGIFSDLTVEENMLLAARQAQRPNQMDRQRLAWIFELFPAVEKFWRHPAGKLSGGQKQRTAIGRAIVREPKLFLFDEPIAHLDAKLRARMRGELKIMQRRLGTTMIYVTHDQVEAMTMGDRVAVLKDGLLQQVDTPRNLYDRPANAFVAGFIGSPAMNLLLSPVNNGQAQLGHLSIPVPASAGQHVIVGVRPEGWAPASSGFEVKVEVVEELGSDAYVYGKPVDSAVKFANATDEGAQVIVRWDPKNPPKIGDQVSVQANPDAIHLFNADSGLRL